MCSEFREGLERLHISGLQNQWEPRICNAERTYFGGCGNAR
jgi:hypothetical protein